MAYLLREPVDKCMEHLYQRRMSGRAKLALDIQGKGAQEESKNIGELLKPLGGSGYGPTSGEGSS